MHYSAVVLLAALAAQTSAHAVVTEVQGANGVNMPGLSVIDGTPRDCASPLCGAEGDTSIIRDDELGSDEASALGRTENGGPVDAAAAISTFMGTSTSTSNKRGLLGDLFGGSSSGSGSGTSGASDAAGTETPDGTTEQGVAKAAGKGATSGLPTCADDGTVTMTFHQVNQDGAGALTADVDPTSGGTDASAFQPATVTQDVPGFGNLGLSGTTKTDFPVKIQMAAGTTCSAKVGGATNVCVARVRNNSLAGPFGGSVAFTQSAAAKKRAVEYNLKKRHFARGVLGKLNV